MTAATAALGMGFPAIIRSKAKTKNVIVLGIDGMDNRLMKYAMNKGLMPNTSRLMGKGSFSVLRTSDPPQSPVAWSNVISGTNPGGHGIYDFIARDPSTLMPYLSTSRVEKSKRNMKIGKWSIPLSPGEISNLRKGPTFWKELETHGIDSAILRMPANFPPTGTSAKTLSGLGTPDIHGSYGIFSFFTDDPAERTRDVPGGHIERIRIRNHIAECVLPGPVNTFATETKHINIGFKAFIDPMNPTARIILQNNDFILQENEWSDWVIVKFTMIPHMANVTGICRFFLKKAHDNFALYVSPVNIDPANPSLPISTPDNYSARLAAQIGRFYTQGMPQDTSALSSGVLDDDEYRQQATYVLEEELRIFNHEFENFQNGLFFAYFSSLDLNSHAFWRTMHTGHPLFSPQLYRKHGDFLPWLYGQMDAVIGRALEKTDDKTLLMTISDHGFETFCRQFNLNSWLLDNGYAQLANGATRGEGTYFQDIDWKRTKAYGLGLNGLYINLKGRELHGCVTPGAEYQSLVRKLAAELKDFLDPENGNRVISNVYNPSSIYSGPYVADAPDLLVGYNISYRASWDTILGKYPREHVLDNTDKWSGDHATDAPFVPGVFLSNRKAKTGFPSLIDIAPTILSEYGIAKPAEMTGNSIFG